MRFYLTPPLAMQEVDLKVIEALRDEHGWRVEFEDPKESIHAFCDRMGIHIGSFKRMLRRDPGHPPVDLFHSRVGKRIQAIRSNPDFDAWVEKRRQS